jgi:hypothetical protein
MLSVGSGVGSPDTSLLRRVGSNHQSVLYASGNEDMLIPTYKATPLRRPFPNAQLIIYPDSGVPFLLQFPKEFRTEVVRFFGAGNGYKSLLPSPLVQARSADCGLGLRAIAGASVVIPLRSP